MRERTIYTKDLTVSEIAANFIINYWNEFEEYDNSYSDFTPNNKVNIGGMIPLIEAYEQAKYEALNKF